MLAVAEESLERNDADRIELDWMGWCHAFNPSEAQQRETSTLLEQTESQPTTTRISG